MRVQGIRLEIVILALLLALASFFGVQYLIRQFFIGQPLQEELLQLKGIRGVELIDVQDGLLLQLEMGAVANILLSYQEIKEIGERLIKNQDFTISIINQEKELESIFYQLHYQLYQLLEQRDYMALKEFLAREGEKLGLDEAVFFLDDNYLYLQLIAGDLAYYRIIPRTGKGG